MLNENILNKTENYGDELMNFGLITTDVTAGEVPGDATPCTDFESRNLYFKGKRKIKRVVCYAKRKSDRI